uniref:Uncharacterized protein n=1 Tax=Lepeophtheirus salmonis TaxID=72036 RepID=A0A0K2VES0_LEPSM
MYRIQNMCVPSYIFHLFLLSNINFMTFIPIYFIIQFIIVAYKLHGALLFNFFPSSLNRSSYEDWVTSNTPLVVQKNTLFFFPLSLSFLQHG